jgi:DNA-directed RNA polymerase subunit RPC12/RpoP
MRDLTEKEINTIFKTGRCQFCGSKDLYAGPSGGMMTNYRCDNCGACYNLPPLGFPFGQLINEPTKDHEQVGGFMTKPTRSIGDSKAFDLFEAGLSKIGKGAKVFWEIMTSPGSGPYE